MCCQFLFCHPACQYGPSTRLLPQKTSGELLGRLIFQLTPRSSMTQLFPCLVPSCPDGSGAFCSGAGRCAARLHQWGYTDNPLCVCGATQTMSHIVDRYTSSMVVSLPSTQHLIPPWSGCVIAAYAKEKFLFVYPGLT